MISDKNRPKYFRILILLLFFFSWDEVSFGLEPAEVLVVANKKMAGSVDIAKYYMEQRNIPASHLLSVSLSLEETMSREEYENVLSISVLKTLNKLQSKYHIAAIVLIYGVPLKIAPTLPNLEERELIQQYKKERNEIAVSSVMSVADIGRKKKELSQKITALLNINERAAVDSEMSLVKAEKYSLDGWIKNPYFLNFQGMTLDINKNQVLLVCRLDGPDAETVYRVINDTLEAEQKGLQGKAYFDARWPLPTVQNNLSGYRLYDASLHNAGVVVAKRMDVVIDDREELFQTQACPEAALYCGWYSLAQYIDSFDWQKGAIGYHIASSECSTLRNKSSSVWCLKMLEKGVAATIGPVYEPYVQGFPLPVIFFSHLIDGYLSLGESYLVSVPYLSWQMVLIGDPLYQPFPP